MYYYHSSHVWKFFYLFTFSLWGPDPMHFLFDSPTSPFRQSAYYIWARKLMVAFPSDSCLTARPFVTANRACFCDKCDTIASRYGYWYSTASRRRRADTPSDWYTSLLRRAMRDPKNVWVEPKSSHLPSLLLLVFGTAASVRLKENQTLVANGKFQGKRRSSIKFESYQKRSHFCIPK